MTGFDLTTSLYTAAQVRAIDRAAIERLGIPGIELMRRAAEAAFAALREHWPDARRVAILAGHGNNGGDGFLLGKLALEHGLDADAIALADTSTGDAAIARNEFVKAGGRIHGTRADVLDETDVIVDGLFGTGLSRAIDGEAAALVERANRIGAGVLALDIPSGLSADTGMRLGPAIRADATVSFVAWKRGLFTGDAAGDAGALRLAPLDMPAAAFAGVAPDATLVEGAGIAALPSRRGNVHKGRFGHVLVIGGDEGMGGAVRLAGEAALRTGAGLVSVATRAANVAALIAARPELMPRAAEDAGDLDPLLARSTVVAIGPGLGIGEWGRLLLRTALASGQPLVLDADALNLVAATPRASDRAVLTPHPGEAARLLDASIDAVQRDRFAAVRALAARYRSVVVLKGAGSLIAAPDGRVAVCRWGNGGMATGGMGDVLTGVIAALIAQGLAAWDAACLGVSLHARAGDVAAGDAPRGLIASDLFAPLRALANGRDP